MSHFTVVLNALLDRMKAETGITRQEFAKRIGMNNSTLHNYANGRAVSDAKALGMIASGFSDDDAFAVLRASLLDALPEEWQTRIDLVGRSAAGRPLTIEAHDRLPAKFRGNIELILTEAERNEHIIAFIEEFVALLGLNNTEVSPRDVLCPEKLPVQVVRRSAVFPTKPSSSSTPAPGDRARPRAARGSKAPRSNAPKK